MCRSCSVASRLRCAGSRTTTTGATRCAAPCCSTPRPTCWCSAWASGRCGKWPTGCTAASASTEIRDVRGTALLVNDAEMKRHEADPARMVADRKTVVLPSYEEVVADKRAFALMSRSFQLETNPGNARPLAQRHGQRGVYYNPPAFPLEDGAGSGGTSVSMDELYDLPFTRVPHPMYTERIPGYDTVKHSSCSCAAASAGARSARSPSTRAASSRTARPRACCARSARCAGRATSAGPSPTSAGRPPTCTSSPARARRSSRSAGACPACTRACARTSGPTTAR